MKLSKSQTIGLLWLGALPFYALAADSTIPFSAKQQQALGIKTVTVTSANAESILRLPGEIAIPTHQEHVLSATQAGLIESLQIAAGDEVKKGQNLGSIVSTELVSLQRDYLQAMTRYNLAKNAFNRDAELYKDGIIAQRRYIETKSHLDEASTELTQSKHMLQLAGMPEKNITQLARSGKFSNRMNLIAPINGHILEQMVNIGQRVETATPLLRIAHLSPLWLEIHAPVEHLPYMRKGMSVKIPNYDAEGKIIAIVRAINKNDQTVHIRAEITRNENKLSPGQFVEADVVIDANTSFTKETSPQLNHFKLPKNAITRQGAESYVFIKNANGFVPTKVIVLSEQADYAVVSGQFADNTQVATSGTVAIKAAWNANGSEK